METYKIVGLKSFRRTLKCLKLYTMSLDQPRQDCKLLGFEEILKLVNSYISLIRIKKLVNLFAISVHYQKNDKGFSETDLMTKP
jgi:hypothetical protein